MTMSGWIRHDYSDAPAPAFEPSDEVKRLQRSLALLRNDPMTYWQLYEEHQLEFDFGLDHDRERPGCDAAVSPGHDPGTPVDDPAL
jgi:hypothetical protein